MILRIFGGFPLSGKIAISGAKNASLPVMAASILTDKELRITNLPDILDVKNFAYLLESIGAQICFDQFRTSATLTCKNLTQKIDPVLAKTTRASMWLLGPLLARFGKIRLPMPGGCNLNRRMDLHISVLSSMGATINLEGDLINASITNKLIGTKFTFPKCSVGATINAIMAAVLAKGNTLLENCAQEPEVTNLCLALQKMGAQISHSGNSTIEIQGSSSLNGAVHEIIGDRLEAATYAIAVRIAGGEVTLSNIDHDLLSNVFDTFIRAGIKIDKISHNSIKISCFEDIKATDIYVAPHPAFPTDIQPLFASLMCTAKGTSKITENVHPGRFLYTNELRKMGANIVVDKCKGTAIIAGTPKLTKATVEAHDLRGGAALVTAALGIKGETIITNAQKIYRGYQEIEKKLSQCGAKVYLEQVSNTCY